MHSRKAIALAAFVFTYLFFFEYIPPFRWVHIPYDLQLFHYPLADYAFQRLRQGQIPLWDPTIYCGMSFVANIQAALFYPTTWVLFLLNLGRERLSYQSMQDLVMAHVWLGFMLCYLWLRGKRLRELPCILGAGVFAFSGYMCSQLQHFGQVGGYTWIPFALWGIDQAVERRSWRPLWKLSMASALCFLAGYPPTWMVFAVVVGTYSMAGAWRWKAALGTTACLIFSLMLCAIQVLPAWEVKGLREPESRYSLGLKDPDLVLSYVLPNYFDFNINLPVDLNLQKGFFYLGVPAVAALPFLIRRRRFRDLVPSLAVLAASLVMAVNPWNVVWNVIRHSNLLPDVLRAWYFLAGVTVAFSALTAYGLDSFLSEKRRVPAWLAPISFALMGVWGGSEMFRWQAQSFAAGWRSGLDMLATLAIFAAGIYAARAAEGRRRIWMTAALILFVGIDYKAFGTSKRFNASGGDAPRFSSTSYPGIPNDVYQQLRASEGYRIVMDNDTGYLPNDFRHMGLATPQGFDPMMTRQLRNTIAIYEHFRSDRAFDLDPANETALKLLGVRYVITGEIGGEPSPLYQQLKGDPHYRLLGAEPTFHRVFEYLDAQPSYSWEDGGPNDLIRRRTWEPESRVFDVRTAAGGQLALHEQLFPGWTATIDGNGVSVEPWMGAFQAVTVPPGTHTVGFRYRSRLLGLGAGISMVALLGLAFWIHFEQRSPAYEAM